MTWKLWKDKKKKKKGKKEEKRAGRQLIAKSNGSQLLLKEPVNASSTPATVPASSVLAIRPIAYILNLPPSLLHQIITTRLEPSCAILLSISCKTIYILTCESIPTLYAQLASPKEKIALLRLFLPTWPPSSVSNDASASSYTRCHAKQRAPPLLCVPCLIYHSPEHLLMYPHPRPEGNFLSYVDFALQKPRVCVRNALRRGRWTPGADMGDGEHVLCVECLTPRAKSEGICAWNCASCGRCTGRASWGPRCVGCSGGHEWDGEEEELVYERAREAMAGLWLGKTPENDIVKSEPLVGRLWKPGAVSAALVSIGKEVGKVRECGKCLGVIGFAEGRHDLCRCGDESVSSFAR